ncbi:hypothetical protein SMACR_05335 [Sordaria macrospora]|uniref:WGS project CABT00000000 data, contig 2.25 n=2 Tax=Sordaria macrospora TaxID=5147 RepID=F7W3K7_SORMK|nr:uncharacterized protein SMAC_05335 [Sordaria macrospora k-hell]KAA8633829.1 hypothetical protein SMACR_05335 [Sordaria macrospora]WPJ63367.1 hypothetical protein SMAC4_05335 [Sordaria macrospora]CCC12263.1 unnamed protein product [Sordaria macrospora k-hell]
MSKPQRVDAAVDEFLNDNPGQSIPSILQKYGLDHSTLYPGVTAMAARDRDQDGNTGLRLNNGGGGKSSLTKLRTSSGGTNGSAAKLSTATQKKTQGERADAAWEEYLSYSNDQRPKSSYFAEKYGIHKSTMSASKTALKKQGVDVELLLNQGSDNGKAKARATAKANANGVGRMTARAGAEVVDLMSDSDLEELEAETEEDEMIEVESDVIRPQPQKLSLTRRQITSMELSDIQERYLVNWYVREESLGRGAPTRAKLTSMALSLLFDGQKPQLDLGEEEWLDVIIRRFLARNPEIKVMMGEGGGEEEEEMPVGCAPAPEVRKKAKEGVNILWEPTAAEAAAAAATMAYVSNDQDDEENDLEDEEDEDDDESASESEDSEEDDSDSDSDSDSDTDSDTSTTDTSTSTNLDHLYNQVFVDSLFVKLEESIPSLPLPSSSHLSDDNRTLLPTPQSSQDIKQHYLSALQRSSSATQTAQIVKALCTEAGRALDLKNSELNVLREKAERLEGEDKEQDQEEQERDRMQEEKERSMSIISMRLLDGVDMSMMSMNNMVDEEERGAAAERNATTTHKGPSTTSTSSTLSPFRSATTTSLPLPPERGREGGGQTTDKDKDLPLPGDVHERLLSDH